MFCPWFQNKPHSNLTSSAKCQTVMLIKRFNSLNVFCSVCYGIAGKADLLLLSIGKLTELGWNGWNNNYKTYKMPFYIKQVTHVAGVWCNFLFLTLKIQMYSIITIWVRSILKNIYIMTIFYFPSGRRPHNDKMWTYASRYRDLEWLLMCFSE